MRSSTSYTLQTYLPAELLPAELRPWAGLGHSGSGIDLRGVGQSVPDPESEKRMKNAQAFADLQTEVKTRDLRASLGVGRDDPNASVSDPYQRIMQRPGVLGPEESARMMAEERRRAEAKKKAMEAVSNRTLVQGPRGNYYA